MIYLDTCELLKRRRRSAAALAAPITLTLPGEPNGAPSDRTASDATPIGLTTSCARQEDQSERLAHAWMAASFASDEEARAALLALGQPGGSGGGGGKGEGSPAAVVSPGHEAQAGQAANASLVAIALESAPTALSCTVCAGAHRPTQCPEIRKEWLRQERLAAAGRGIHRHYRKERQRFLLAANRASATDLYAMAEAMAFHLTETNETGVVIDAGYILRCWSVELKQTNQGRSLLPV